LKTCEENNLNKYHWQSQSQPESSEAAELALALGIPRAGARFLVSRSLAVESEARMYLSPDPSLAVDPFAFGRMEEAVECIRDAARRGKKAMVHGDYDVDGISGTALLYLYLRRILPNVARFLPDRRKDGYGLSKRAVEWALANGVGLVIAVDCGTSDGELVETLISAGIDVVICDHHEFPPRQLPPGIVLNPFRPGEEYPFKYLCGTGVAFKLVQALHASGVTSDVEPDELLDLVALATIGDLVPLVGENRYFARKGLEIINSAPRPGMKALIENSSARSGDISAGIISFRLAPRLNAPGRVSRARPALELLLSEEEAEARGLAAVLERENVRRRELTELVYREAMDAVERIPDPDSLGGFILGSERWDEGVLGIVASQLAESLGRPAILFSISGETAKGSGRSVPGVHLKSELDKCKELMIRYGGHSQAVGVTIRTDKMDAFRNRLSDQLLEAVKELPPKPVLLIDGELTLEECTLELADFFARCEPFGYGNKEPVWKIPRLRVMDDTRIVGNGHLKLFFQDERGEAGEAIFFNGGLSTSPASLFGRRIDVAVKVRKNYYMNRHRTELRVVDARISDE
jgi:single-stranded-DNA-specific exonuclease